MTLPQAIKDIKRILTIWLSKGHVNRLDIIKLIMRYSFLKLMVACKTEAITFYFCIIFLFFSNFLFSQPPAANGTLDLMPIALGAQLFSDNLQSPTAMAFPGKGEVWITEQTGKIRVVKNGKMTDLPLLDLGSKMVKLNMSYEERGLLGIALHPRFSANRKFYVFYSAPKSVAQSDHTDVVAEYTLSSKSQQVDPNSGKIIMTFVKPEGNHDGGCLQFGKDGYLYISLGDGGGQGDKHGKTGNGQNLNTWLGKILRINVNTDSGYLVPKDNPFVGKDDIRPEIWAYGFRNVWRFSFDQASGQLFAGDVGQDLWEEVNIIKKGANYGWRIVEATHCYNPATACSTSGITMPISEYNHREGVSVTGGYVYNGLQLPVLKSKYLFADWTGPLFYLQKSGAVWKRGKVTLKNIPSNLKVLAFGEDPLGELYLLTNPDTGPANTKCSIFKIVRL